MLRNSHGRREQPTITVSKMKEKRRSAKSDFSKVLFPDIGKITNRKHWMCWKVSMVKTTVLFICDQLLGELIQSNFIIQLLIYFWLLMPGVNYVIYGCSSARTTPVSLYRSLNWRKTLLQLLLKTGW